MVFPVEGVTILDAMGKAWHVECFRYGNYVLEVLSASIVNDFFHVATLSS